MKGKKRIEFDRETVQTLTKKALADAAISIFGELCLGEEVKVEFDPWGSSSAEICPIEAPEPAARVPVPTVTDGVPF
jgi:hypothetical protein